VRAGVSGFQVLQAIVIEIRHPNSTRQAHFNPFKLPCSTRNRYYAVILTVMFFNGGFLGPGSKFFMSIQ
jgi:hypothetical protein